jgi:hypothetical protein
MVTCPWRMTLAAGRMRVSFTQYGEVAVPNQSGHVYLVTNRHGQHRLTTLSRPMISGEIVRHHRDAACRARLAAHPPLPRRSRCCRSTMCPMRPTAGSRRATLRGALYRDHLQRVTGEPFAMFLP